MTLQGIPISFYAISCFLFMASTMKVGRAQTVIPDVPFPAHPEDSAMIPRGDSLLQIRQISLLESRNFLKWDGHFEKQLAKVGMRVRGAFSAGFNCGYPADVNALANDGTQQFLQGQLSTDVLGIPMKLSGQYLTSAQRMGAQNFLRLEYDSEQQKSAMKSQLDEKLTMSRVKEKSIREELQKVLKSSAFSSAQLNSLPEFDEPALPRLASPEWPTPTSPTFSTRPPEIPEIELPDAPDIWPTRPSWPGLDSLFNRPVPTIAGMSDARTDSLQKVLQSRFERPELADRLDSLRRAGAALQDSLDQLKSYQAEIENRRRQLDHPDVDPPKGKWLGIIRRFQMGQVTPVFSGIMLTPLPLNGIYLKLETEKRDLDIVHGQSVNDGFRLASRRDAWIMGLTQEFIPTTRSVGDRITAGMVSVWKRDKDFVRFGYLYGIDKWADEGTTSAPTSGGPIGRNGVSEINARFSFLKEHFVEFAYARSSYKSITPEEDRSTSMPISGLDNQSACKAKVNLAFRQQGVTVTGESRLIGSSFRSLGAPFLRDDLFMEQVKVTKEWKNGWDVSVGQKFQRTNVSNQFPVTTEIHSWTIRGTARPTRRIQVMGLYAPLLVRTSDSHENTETSSGGGQWLLSGVMQHQTATCFHLIRLQVSAFTMESDEVRSGTWDVEAGIRSTIQSKWTLDTAVRMQQFDVADSLWKGRMFILTHRSEYQVKDGVQVTFGCSLSTSSEQAMQWGGVIGGSAALSKHSVLVLQAERLIRDISLPQPLQDMMNTYPYRLQIQFNLTIT